ncbi:hypothetical protein BC938DRAFT_480687, partial [Jimgerdemannia flammicorona]
IIYPDLITRSHRTTRLSSTGPSRLFASNIHLTPYRPNTIPSDQSPHGFATIADCHKFWRGFWPASLYRMHLRHVRTVWRQSRCQSASRLQLRKSSRTAAIRHIMGIHKHGSRAYIDEHRYVLSRTPSYQLCPRNFISCNVSILACATFYAGSNIVMYLWLIERVWIVTLVKTSRMESLLYKFHLLLLTPYIGIFILMVLFRIGHLNPDETCHIGLQRIASIPLLVILFIFYVPWGKRLSLPRNVFVRCNIERGFGPLGA